MEVEIKNLRSLFDLGFIQQEEFDRRKALIEASRVVTSTSSSTSTSVPAPVAPLVVASTSGALDSACIAAQLEVVKPSQVGSYSRFKDEQPLGITSLILLVECSSLRSAVGALAFH